MNFEIYKYWGKLLTEALQKAYMKGVKSIMELNKEKILGIKKTKKFSDKPLFEVNWTDTDNDLLRNFTVEAFTVAAVNSFELEEKLKTLAIDLMKQNKLGDKELWQSEAYNIILQYIPETEEVPPPSYLQTNLQTAINSAYHGSRYQRLKDLQDVYTHWQYKTQADAAVRDEHRVLHNRIWRSNDQIWQEIYPPNGWNCRCYINPMTIEEVSKSGVEPEQIIDQQSRTELLNQAKIPKEFRRNSSEIKSIWGKWLQSKLTDKMYGEITERLKNYANKMPRADEAIERLNKNAAPFRKLEYSKENWEKEFPGDKVITPLEEIKMGDFQFSKIPREKRQYMFGLIKPTLSEPEYILIAENNATLFLKSFKDKRFFYTISALKYKEGKEIIVSNHERSDTEEIKKIVKKCKLLIYSRSERPSSHGQPADKKLAETGRLNFSNINKSDVKINPEKVYYGELWGELVPSKIYSSVLRRIIYRINGFDVEIIKSGKTKIIKDDYSNIDKYRIGVLIERI